MFATIAVLAAPAGSTFDPARTFLMTAFGLSAAEVARVDCGDVVSRTLEVSNRREVATLGIVRIGTTPSRYVGHLADITTFKRSRDVLQVGKFSSPPQAQDLAALLIDERDLSRLRDCRVDHCEVRLPAADIERLHRETDWNAPDAPEKATLLMRQFLLEYVVGYRQHGVSAQMEYADRAQRLNVGREFASMLDDDTITSKYFPPLHRFLLQGTDSSTEHLTDFLYWSKELVRGRPVVSVTNVAIETVTGDAPVAYAIASKQLYATHYFDASLGLTLLVPDRTAAAPVTYVVYLNRSRVDLFDGLFGSVVRRIVAGRARGIVAEQLERLQQVLAEDQS
jgi:hypothetical protein